VRVLEDAVRDPALMKDLSRRAMDAVQRLFSDQSVIPLLLPRIRQAHLMKLHAVGADREKRAQMGFLAYSEFANGTGCLQKAERHSNCFLNSRSGEPGHERLVHSTCSALKHSSVCSLWRYSLRR